MMWVFGLLVFIASTAALTGLFFAFGLGEGAGGLTRRLHGLQTTRALPPPQGNLLRADPLGRNPWVKDLLGRLPRIRSVQETLDRAGISLGVGGFLFVWVLLDLSVGLMALAATRGTLLAAAVAALSVHFLPMAWVSVRLRRRERTVENQLPDALKLLANSLRAGHSLGTGLKVVGEEVSPPLGPCFQKLIDEMSVGLPFDKAMRNLAHRLGGADIKLLATAILIQRETGGNLAEVVDNISALILERLKLRRQVRVLTAQGRLTGWVLGIMPLALGLVLAVIHPELMRPLLTTTPGKMMLVTAFGLQALGALAMRRIIRIPF